MLINRHVIVKTEEFPPRINKAGRPVTVTRNTYDNGLRLTYEAEHGGVPILVHLEEPPQRPLPRLKGWRLNMGGETV